MCGIAGILRLDGGKVDKGELTTLRDAMVNRGPDHGGLWSKGGIGLAHRRLKIIDLSEQGNQPMANEDGRIRVVFNGEIYNFQSLRKQLAEKGHRFRSQTDTEVIAHGYEEWREDLFEKLDGMFAIAVWNEETRALTLARDRFGKKPLFFLMNDNELIFASEIKAIWEIRKAALTIEPRGIDCFLHHLSPTQDFCIYREVTKVRPGQRVRVDMEGRLVSETYWRPSFQKKKWRTPEETIDRVDETLRNAVRKRLISDVPLGAFLSGGIDSSLVVAMMSHVSSDRAKTFSIGFEEQDFSELEYARAVADYYDTEHEEIILKPDVQGILPSLVWEYGEPFADSSAIPTYYVSKAAREHVTVVLTGDGGDELFGGYDIARASHYASLLSMVVPGSIRAMLEDLLLPDERVLEGQGPLQKLRTLLVHSSDRFRKRHRYTQAWTAGHKAGLYTEAFVDALEGWESWQYFQKFGSAIRDLKLVDQNLFQTIVGRLPNDYLIKIDVASMMNSMELRSPFLDRDLSDLSESIEPELKVKGGTQKFLLKKVAERYLPHEVIYRPKRGFSLPLKHWLASDFHAVARDLILNGSVLKKGWFRRECVVQTLDEHQSRKKDHTHRIWSLLWLEIWYRLFIEQSMNKDDSLA